MADDAMSNPDGQRCAWGGCNRAATGEDSLKRCGRCRKISYCSQDCQKTAWKTHKWVCVGHATPRHRVQGMTLAAIQSKIDQAQPGNVVEIPAGRYTGDGETSSITISKPLYILGEGMKKVEIIGDLNATDEAKNGGSLVVADLKIDGCIKVTETEYEKITFLSVEVNCPRHIGQSGSDAFDISGCNGKVLLFCCEIIGGSDGLMISGSPGVHIKDTDIQLAGSRGIFANDSFVIQDSAVYNCGSYGIKGRAGWDEKGPNNEIQPGPWSCFGGASGF
jgi:hypothetical protein